MNNFKSNNPTSFLPKLVGETRHYPPAVKEWKDSVYTYNKYFLKGLPSKNIMASKIIKSYFNLSDCKHLARSKRMRSLIRKSSAGKLFISRPEFKQTNDNVAITIYTLDRERQMLLRKIYHNIRKWENKRNVKGISRINVFNSYDYWRSRYSLNRSLNILKNNVLMSHKNNMSNDKLKRKYLSLKNPFFKNNVLSVNRMHYLRTRLNLYSLKKKRKNTFFKSIILGKKGNIKRKDIPYFGITSLSEAKFLRYISQFKNNSIQARKRVYYSYMKRILFLLGIKVLAFDMVDNNINITQYNNLKYKGNILLFFKGGYGKPEMLSINSIQENLPYLDKVNIVLSSFVKKILSNNNLVNSGKFSLANYSNINFKEYLLKEYTDNSSSFSNNNSFKTKLDFLKKEISLVKDYINVKINSFKFGKYLPALKLLMGKIYNKNVQLNIVKLKYLYLNSDIFTEAISMKLRKKVNFSRVISKALKLVEIPKEFNEVTSNINNIRNLNVYKSLKLKNLLTSNTTQNNIKDNLDLVIKNLYPLSFINQQKKSNMQPKAGAIQQDENNNIKYTSNKLTDIINVVKYKWVTGVRLEAAGRLTRRYTASRSVYKYKYKGSLKNTDFSRKLDFLKKSMPVVMLRNNAKTNSQYTFTKSKKRIGAFGIKGWISSY